jgi:lipopolysaccharide/colanic/teichoic acid biosynthesis glycosyltransferase
MSEETVLRKEAQEWGRGRQERRAAGDRRREQVVLLFPDRRVRQRRKDVVTAERVFDERVYAIPYTELEAKEPVLRVCYRVFEVLLSLTALIILSPIMLIEAIIIRLDTPGNVLFFQNRMTRATPVPGRELKGRKDLKSATGEFEDDKLYLVPTTFKFVKFRTMYADASERFEQLYNYKYTREEFLAERFKKEKDPRVTPVGRWLRKSTLDELPNFWSVLTGEMNLVGPRPELPDILPNYDSRQMRKFSVKPGVTGLAQISGRGALSYKDTINYDLEYIERRSVWLDIKIVAKTIFLVIVRNGAY